MKRKIFHRKNFFKLLFIPSLLLIFLMSATGCSLFTSEKNDEKKEKENPVIETPEPVTEEVVAIPTSPYTGEPLTEEEMIPFMAVIENSNLARPQSGLTEADIVFETMAEGGIPRFIALFHSKSPDIIGPIRSARPYFLDLSVEYGLPFAHCGGSAEALESISTGIGLSLNEFRYGSHFWRDSSRKAPHNLYTSAEKLRALIKDLGYIKAPESLLSFQDSYWNDNTHATAQDVIIKANNNYTTAYTYKDGTYHKSMNSTESTDRETGNFISAKNIVIQITDIETRGDGRLNIRLTGEGEGFLISSGYYEKITWKKNEKGGTELFDNSGKKIPLNTGNTWWHIVSPSFNITINGE